MTEAVTSAAVTVPSSMGETEGATRPAILVESVAPSAARSVWPHVRSFIEASRGYGLDLVSERELTDDVLDKIEGGAYQLWLIFDESSLSAVTVTSIEQMSRSKVLVVQYQAGSDIDIWLETFVEETAGWAKENGCDQAQVSGRDGWAKKLKPFGFKRAFVTYVKGL